VNEEIRREVRRAVSQIRLGTDRAVACTVCGESNPGLLRRASRQLVEYHHLAGGLNDPDLGVFLCLTHHAWCTQVMLDNGIPIDRVRGRSLPERLEAVLRGLAIFFELAAGLLRLWADQLEDLVHALDQSHNGWRDLQEAS
jgi:hypothetical protein